MLGGNLGDGPFALRVVLDGERQLLAKSGVDLGRHVIDQGVIEDEADQYVAAHADDRGGAGHFGRPDPIRPFRPHDATTR